MTLIVRTDPKLLEHLRFFAVDGCTVGGSLFDGSNRLTYPGRNELERELKFVEPYTLEHEARVVIGMPRQLEDAIRTLANNVWYMVPDVEPTLELLWAAHSAWSQNGISLDRIVAAQVTLQAVVSSGDRADVPEQMYDASMEFIEGMRKLGFPLRREALEELFDGADPACIGLGLVEL